VPIGLRTPDDDNYWGVRVGPPMVPFLVEHTLYTVSTIRPGLL
jgi:hypothetical protein